MPLLVDRNAESLASAVILSVNEGDIVLLRVLRQLFGA
jgi:hypothetical protein